MSSSRTETALQPDVTRLQPETDFSSSRDRVRIHRAQEIRTVPAAASRQPQEERGYLDPDSRGERPDEAEAIETFLMDALTKR
jgi:hypothetical protein